MKKNNKIWWSLTYLAQPPHCIGGGTEAQGKPLLDMRWTFQELGAPCLKVSLSVPDLCPLWTPGCSWPQSAAARPPSAGLGRKRAWTQSFFQATESPHCPVPILEPQMRSHGLFFPPCNAHIALALCQAVFSILQIVIYIISLNERLFYHRYFS